MANKMLDTKKKLKTYKDNLKKEILKAIMISTANKANATTGLSFIVSQVQKQISGLAKFPGSLSKKEKLIKIVVYEMKKNNEIGYKGRNQYCMKQAGQPVEKMEKVPPEHFRVPSKKRLPETSTQLDPAKKRRHSSDLSLSSLSGDEFEKERKRFRGAKQLMQHKFNPLLPGARQVQAESAPQDFLSPGTSHSVWGHINYISPNTIRSVLRLDVKKVVNGNANENIESTIKVQVKGTSNYAENVDDDDDSSNNGIQYNENENFEIIDNSTNNDAQNVDDNDDNNNNGSPYNEHENFESSDTSSSNYSENINYNYDSSDNGSPYNEHENFESGDNSSSSYAENVDDDDDGSNNGSGRNEIQEEGE